MERRTIVKGLIYITPLLTTISAYADGYGGSHGSNGTSSGASGGGKPDHNDKPDKGKDKPDRPDPSPPSPPDHGGEPNNCGRFLKSWEC